MRNHFVPALIAPTTLSVLPRFIAVDIVIVEVALESDTFRIIIVPTLWVAKPLKFEGTAPKTEYNGLLAVAVRCAVYDRESVVHVDALIPSATVKAFASELLSWWAKMILLLALEAGNITSILKMTTSPRVTPDVFPR